MRNFLPYKFLFDSTKSAIRIVPLVWTCLTLAMTNTTTTAIVQIWKTVTSLDSAWPGSWTAIASHSLSSATYDSRASASDATVNYKIRDRKDLVRGTWETPSERRTSFHAFKKGVITSASHIQIDTGVASWYRQNPRAILCGRRR